MTMHNVYLFIMQLIIVLRTMVKIFGYNFTTAFQLNPKICLRKNCLFEAIFEQITKAGGGSRGGFSVLNTLKLRIVAPIFIQLTLIF